MQEINAIVRNSVRTALLPFLQANAPIRNIEAKAMLLNQLGFTKDQFGYTDTGISRIEVLIGNEFFRLKKMGQVEQEGWIWMLAGQSAQATPATQAPRIQRQATQVEFDIPVVLEDEEPIVNEEVIIEEAVVNEAPVVAMVTQTTTVIETPANENTQPNHRLLQCEGYRNSLIESTACYGTYSKNDCNGCLLAFWCKPFTEQVKALRREERQAKTQSKNEKEAFLEKYNHKTLDVLNLIANIGSAVELTKKSTDTALPCFLSDKEIANGEKYYFVINFGIVSKEIYDQVKNFK